MEAAMRALLTTAAVLAALTSSASADSFRDLRAPFMSTVATINGMHCLIDSGGHSAWCSNYGKMKLGKCDFPAIVNGEYTCITGQKTSQR
jgi:hypothetical protein